MMFVNLCSLLQTYAKMDITGRKKNVVRTALKHLFFFYFEGKICGFGFQFLEKCFLFS